VVVNYSRSAGEAKRVAGGIVEAGGRAVAVQADVQKLAEHQRLSLAGLTSW